MSSPFVIPTTFWHLPDCQSYLVEQREKPALGSFILNDKFKLIKTTTVIISPYKVIQTKLFYFPDQIIQLKKCQNSPGRPSGYHIHVFK